MSLETGRDLFRGVMILLAVAVADWVNLTAGLLLAAFIGIMILQSAVTNWCPADLVLRFLGLKRRQQSRQ